MTDLMFGAAYEYRCPFCDALHSVGFNDANYWWETRCTRCGTFYHYGDVAATDGRMLYTFRCPALVDGGVCNRMRHVGLEPPTDESWWETKCFRCHQYYHWGRYGQGFAALVAVADSALAPKLPPSAHVRAVRVSTVESALLRPNSRFITGK